MMTDQSADTTLFAVHLREEDRALADRSKCIADTLQTAGRLHSVLVSPSNGHEPDIHDGQLVLPRMFVAPTIRSQYCIITGKESRLCIPSFASLIAQRAKNVTFHIALDATTDRMEPGTSQASAEGIRLISNAFLQHSAVQFFLTIDGEPQEAAQSGAYSKVHIHSRASEMLERMDIV